MMPISPPKRDLSSRKSLFFGRRLIWAFCFVLVFFISSGLSPRQEGQDFCCPRDALFIPIPMPPEQEYDVSGFISSGFYGALRESDILDCPIKYAEESWTGSASGTGNGAVKNLARFVFSPVDDIIYEYEHIPWSCEVDPEEDEISVGDEMSITIKDIKDSKGREPKPWQRIVVKLEKGEITNGTKLEDEGNPA